MQRFQRNFRGRFFFFPGWKFRWVKGLVNATRPYQHFSVGMKPEQQQLYSDYHWIRWSPEKTKQNTTHTNLRLLGLSLSTSQDCDHQNVFHLLCRLLALDPGHISDLLIISFLNFNKASLHKPMGFIWWGGTRFLQTNWINSSTFELNTLK